MISLKTQTRQGLIATASASIPALAVTIPSTGKPAAQATFRHTGSAGFWYVTLNRSGIGPTSTNYSYKIGPGESRTENNPPLGDIWVLADALANGPLSWYVGWKQ